MTATLHELSHQLVRLARQGREATASAVLQDFLRTFEAELGGLSAGTQQTLLALLPKLLQLQQERDWVAYADVLEYELLPLISSTPG